MTTRPTAPSDATTLEFPRARLVLRLRPEAIRQVQAQTTAGLQAVPRRGAEIGGLLLGSAAGDQGETAIDGVREVPCEHRYGPSFLLTGQDRQGLARAVDEAAASGVIGIYRSHTRDGELLQAEDIALAASVEGARLILIVQPEGLWSGVCHVFLHGTPDRWTHAGAFGLTDLKIAAPAPAAAPVAVAPPAKVARPPRRATRRGVLWSLAVLLLVLLSGAEAWWLWRNARPRSNEAARPVAARPADPLLLRIERAGGDLKVTWNGGSPPVANAVRGKLLIRDGPAARELELDADQLRSGNLLYQGAGRGDVLFRLEVVNGEGRAASESVRLIAGVSAASAPRPASADRIIVSRLNGAPEPPEADPPAAAIATRALTLPGPTRVAQPELPAPSPASSTLALAPPPASARVATPLPPPARPQPAPPAAVPTPPPAAAPASAADRFEQAKAVRQVRPATPSNIRSMLVREVTVTVRTIVDETGKVTHAVPTGDGGVVGRMLGAIAAEAARGWRFEPARRNGVPTTSNVDLVFRFNR